MSSARSSLSFRGSSHVNPHRINESAGVEAAGLRLASGSHPLKPGGGCGCHRPFQRFGTGGDKPTRLVRDNALAIAPFVDSNDRLPRGHRLNRCENDILVLRGGEYGAAYRVSTYEVSLRTFSDDL